MAALAHEEPDPHFSEDVIRNAQVFDDENEDQSGKAIVRPSLEDLQSSAVREQYEREGFLVVRGLLSSDEIETLKTTISETCKTWPEGAPASAHGEGEHKLTPLVDLDPRFRLGKLPMPEDPQDAVRRLFRVCLHLREFEDICKKPTLLAPLQTSWETNDLRLLQSMCLLKPPGTGEKRWHQDQGYFRLSPSRVAAWWIALDATDEGNGCMFVLPRSHLKGQVPHANPVPGMHMYYSVQDPYIPESGKPLIIRMEPGDALFFHGDLIHGTPPNADGRNRRRRALQLHYAWAGCKPIRCAPSDSAPTTEEKDGAVVQAPNDAVLDDARDVDPEKEMEGFDCDPSGRSRCIEPQYWYYRKAELTASGEQKGPNFV